MKKEIKVRLIKHITFLEDEIQDYENFKTLSWMEYNTARDKRRNVERWIENIVNSSIDIAKIILVSENLPLPDTYREIVNSLPEVSGQAAILIDPQSVDQLVDAMMKMVQNKEERERFRQLGLRRFRVFSWKKTADMTIDLYGKILPVI